MSSTASYQALALQLQCHVVNACASVAQAREHIAVQLDRVAQMVAANKNFIGPLCKLVVLPEYVLTGFPMRESFAAWREKACLEVNGREFDALSKIAQDNKIFLAVNAYERDSHFADIFFQGCFLFSPSGDLVLRYRRMNSVFSPTPFDVWNKYLEIHGEDSLFPVADTELGRMAFIASDEILFPEVARMALMKGAEIFLHPSSETHGPMPSGKDVCKQARAVENLAYVISANTAGLVGTHIASASADGGSRIVDWRGRIVAIAGTGESLNANAEINLHALRDARMQTGMQNLVGRQKYAQYARFYADAEGVPSNRLAASTVQDGALPDRQSLLSLQSETLQKLQRLGILS